ncbi:MAG: hypothetical protein ABIW38_06520 [Ferruginibacter sp.]
MFRFFLLFFLFPTYAKSQPFKQELNANWQFRNAGSTQWYKAVVPGTIHTDLLRNKLIPEPFYRDNEKKLHWIDTTVWEYKCSFNIDKKILSQPNIDLIFDGLDTYADAYFNGKKILFAENMFRQYAINIRSLILRGKNELLIRFYPAKKMADSIAAMNRIQLPDNNRVYARKAAFQFGWDWGPAFTSCGIWKKIWIDGYNINSTRTLLQKQRDEVYRKKKDTIKLLQEKDSMGTSFYFIVNGKPLFMKGANYIPADVFLPRVKNADYRKILLMAKNANMNMLRVWGGGIYEADEFYDLCDSLNIYVWQDLMFAGAMYPGDKAFMQNVKEEIKYQLHRLRHHKSIVLWCGNNEIDEAWHHWGWQQQFNLHGEDSAKVWADYKMLFEDSLRKWVNDFDGSRPYVSSSPTYGWGNAKSYTSGDSHYWGLWWGKEPWEKFYEKTGRFVSEYGMQSMPGMNMLNKYAAPCDRFLFSDVIRSHQKATDGFEKLNFYLQHYFIDSSRLKKLSLENYVYLTQCLQYYILKNSIIIHRSKMPSCMGTLLWQLNDCWPVTSWSITDYNRQPKAAWYAVKNAYADDNQNLPDSIYPKAYFLQNPRIKITKVNSTQVAVQSFSDAKYIYLSGFGENNLPDENYFHLKKGEKKIINFTKPLPAKIINVLSLYDVLKNADETLK